MIDVLRLVNARGVPGTASAVVIDRSGTHHLLACYHVLFGAGAKAGDPVWGASADARELTSLARTIRGQLGRVTFAGEHWFIDGAIAELPETLPAALAGAVEALMRINGVGDASVGMRVTKRGPVSGLTHGTVVAVDHFEQPSIDGETYQASRQLRVQGDDPDVGFSVAGDSGAAILDTAGRLVGLLWGSNALGDGIAAPIAPLLDHLGVEVCGVSDE